MNVNEARRRERHDIEAEHVETTRPIRQREGDGLYRCEEPGAKKTRVCAPNEPATTLFLDGISPDDVRQWQIGDCYLLASLAALASTPQGRARLENMIVENRDEAGHVLSYTVNLHPRPVRVDTSVPAGALGVAKNGQIWPAIIEKAYAKAKDSYANIHGGWPHDALLALTGSIAAVLDPDKASTLRIVESRLASGQPVVFSTKSPPLPLGLVGPHAYFATAIETNEKNEKVVVLRNPWGPQMGEVRVPISRWRDAFSNVATT
jgi:hypothetical protein